MFSLFLLFLQEIASKKIIVFDCGSTGTRAMIVSYDNPDDVYSFQQDGNGMDSGYWYTTGKTRKLLDTEEGPDNLNKIMLLFDDLNSYLSTGEDKKTIPLLVYHTAGVRAKSEKDQIDINDLLFKTFTENEKSKGYLIKRENFKVLTGDEEALYQWISVNQIYEYFNSDDTMPMLSMGGESMQYAIELREAPEDDFMKSFVYTIRMNNKYHYVFLYSWLNYGTTPLASLSHKEQYLNNDKTSPCMFKDSKYEILIDGVNDGNYVEDIQGTGNFDQCVERMRPHITATNNRDKCENYNPTVSDYGKDNCVPFADQFNKLYAISCVGDAMRYVPNLKYKNPTYSEFINEVRNYASTATAQVLAHNDNDYNSLWTISNAAMVSVFMEKAFKDSLGENFEKLNFYYEAAHKGKLLAWNVGAAIAYASSEFQIIEPVPYEESWWTAGRIAGVSIGIVAAVAIIIGVVIFFIIKKRRTNDSLSVEQA